MSLRCFMLRPCIFLALVLSAVFLAAQTPDTATLRGQVLDQTRAAVGGADVKLTNTQLGVERSTRTDSAGRFSFTGLPVGTYALTAHKDRFADLQRELTLVGGAAADVQLQLSISEVKTEI